MEAIELNTLSVVSRSCDRGEWDVNEGAFKSCSCEASEGEGFVYSIR